MRLIILSGTWAILLPFLIAQVAEKLGAGLAVTERFLERLNKIPSGTSDEPQELNAINLKDWVEKHPACATKYAWLMPIDVLYLFSLGSFLGLASGWLAEDVQLPASIAGIAVWKLLWGLPVLYMASDLIEDAMIVLFMKAPITITNGSLRAQVLIKNLKIVSVIGGMVLTAHLALLALVFGKSL
jgi:hypothetical protein